MLLMERVREIGADEGSITEENVRVARQALAREAAGSVRPEAARRPRRRTWAGIGIGGLVAGAAVTAIVTGSVLAPPSAPDAAAAEVLERAATVTVDARDANLAPGQYLRIETVSEHLQFWNAAWADDDDESTSAFNASRSGADAAVLVRDTRMLYVPADRSGDWFYDWGHAEVIESFGDRGAEAAGTWSLSPGAQGAARGHVERLPAGQHLAPGGDEPPMPYLADRYRPYYAEMPREPQALLEWLRGQSGMSGAEADRWVVASLSDPSAVNLMPTDLRASFFRAIALIPGFELLDEDTASATLQYVVPGHRTTTIVIDIAQGLVLSIAESYGEGGPSGDIPESVTRVVTSVVDSVPTS